MIHMLAPRTNDQPTNARPKSNGRSSLPLWLRVLAAGTVALVSIGLLWRVLARRWSLPCPPALSWLLENPLTEGVAGKQLIERLDLRPGMRVLDVGCGPGRLTIPVARAVGPTGHVVAIDIQPEMLRRAQAKAAAAGLGNIEFHLADVTTGRLEQEGYERALLVTVLGEIPDRARALRAIFRALKPGGLLSVTEVIPDPHYQSRRTVGRLAQDTGFTETASFETWLAFTINLARQSRSSPGMSADGKGKGIP
jgi:SAM-dependent methyltransferase